MKGDALVIGIGILLLLLVALGLFLFTWSSPQMAQPPVAPVGTVAPAAATAARAAPVVEESTVILHSSTAKPEAEELPEDSNEETVPEGLDDER